MEAIQTLGPLVGVVLGGLLSGIGSQLRARKDRKRIIAAALADLLEVRHRIVAVDLVLQELRVRFKIQPEMLSAARNLFDLIMPPDDSLDHRYDSAISLLAGIEPVLAYSLRSKNTFPRIFSSLRSQASTAGGNMAEFENLENNLRSAVKPKLDEAVLQLARSHSPFTVRKVKKLISSSNTLPPEAEQFFAQMTLVVENNLRQEGAHSGA